MKRVCTIALTLLLLITLPFSAAAEDPDTANRLIAFYNYLELANNTSAPIEAELVNRDGDHISLDSDEVILRILDGEEFITVEGNRVYGEKEGYATIRCEYQVGTSDDGEPILVYSDPVDIHVYTSAVEELMTVGSSLFTLMRWIVYALIGLVVIVVIVCVIVLVVKKKKKKK